MRKEVEDIVVGVLKKNGVKFVVTLPEDPTASLSTRIENDPDFRLVRATNESQGVAITGGIALVGEKTVFITGVAGSLVASWAISMMSILYHIPFVMLISYRGEFGEKSGISGDHLHLFRKVGEGLLRVLDVPYHIVNDPDRLEQELENALELCAVLKSPVALLLAGRVLF